MSSTAEQTNSKAGVATLSDLDYSSDKSVKMDTPLTINCASCLTSSVANQLPTFIINGGTVTINCHVYQGVPPDDDVEATETKGACVEPAGTKDEASTGLDTDLTDGERQEAKPARADVRLPDDSKTAYTSSAETEPKDVAKANDEQKLKAIQSATYGSNGTVEVVNKSQQSNGVVITVSDLQHTVADASLTDELETGEKFDDKARRRSKPPPFIKTKGTEPQDSTDSMILERDPKKTQLLREIPSVRMSQPPRPREIVGAERRKMSLPTPDELANAQTKDQTTQRTALQVSTSSTTGSFGQATGVSSVQYTFQEKSEDPHNANQNVSRSTALGSGPLSAPEHHDSPFPSKIGVGDFITNPLRLSTSSITLGKSKNKASNGNTAGNSSSPRKKSQDAHLSAVGGPSNPWRSSSRISSHSGVSSTAGAQHQELEAGRSQSPLGHSSTPQPEASPTPPASSKRQSLRLRKCNWCKTQFTDKSNVANANGSAPCSYHPGELQATPMGHTWTCCGGGPITMGGLVLINRCSPGCEDIYHQDKEEAFDVTTLTATKPTPFRG